MLNLAVSLLVGLVVHIGLATLTGLNIWISSTIGLVVMALVYILVTRLIMKKFTALMESAQADLQAQRWEKAIRTLQSGMKFAPWQFYIKAQVNSQIGIVYFLKRDFAQAFEYLQKCFVRHWLAMGMLAVCYMKRNKPKQMTDTFEKAVAATKKEPMLWALYAYCLDRINERAKAIDVLERGLRRVKEDERLAENITLLKQGKRMKMKDFGDLWYQFHLEKPGALIKQQTKAVQGRRKMVRR
jgi:tetratricopeptide (TPR) repeat protein